MAHGLTDFVSSMFGSKMKTQKISGTGTPRPSNHRGGAGISDMTKRTNATMMDGDNVPSPGYTPQTKPQQTGPGISDLTMRTERKMLDGDQPSRGGFRPLAGMKPIKDWKPETRSTIANIGAVLSDYLGGSSGDFARNRAKEFSTPGLRQALVSRGYDQEMLRGLDHNQIRALAAKSAAPTKRSGSAATVKFPKPGEYRDGMQYTGGNPNDQASWLDMGQARQALIAGIAGSSGDTSLLSTFSFAQLQKLAAERFGTVPAANDPYANLGQ